MHSAYLFRCRADKPKVPNSILYRIPQLHAVKTAANPYIPSIPTGFLRIDAALDFGLKNDVLA